MTSTACLLLAGTMTLAVTAAWPWQPMPYSAPMLLGFMRPRRAPPAAVPRPPPSSGQPLYPSRTLTFSGYFSGAGAPQNGDPYAFGWGPAVRSAQAEEAPADIEATTALAPLEPQADVPNNPPAVDVPVDVPLDVPVDDNEGGFAARAKPNAGKNKPSKPSYPVPEGPSSGPSSGSGSASAPGAGGSPSWGSREPEDNGSDRGGYGTINAWFPFMFSGGFPNGGDGPRPAAPRGYGAPNPGPAPGSDSRPPAYGGPSPTAGPQGGHGGSPSNSGAEGVRGGSPYYPVAIANSFSTGRNAMASSTATAYGGAPSRS